MTAVILCNGEFPRKDYPLYLLRTADLIVCCDSASNVRRLERLGLEPSAIVGDMDSTPESIRKRYQDRIFKVDEQDYNDLNKAFLWLRGAHPEIKDIHILGYSGGHDAHTLGNLSYLMYWEQRYSLSAAGVRVDMVSDRSTAFAISDSCELHVGEGRKVSVFPSDPTINIKSSGLKWPLDGVGYDFWFKGTLNMADSDIISFQLSRPVPVLIVLD